MGSLALLSASVALAFFGWGWFDAFVGFFDFLPFIGGDAQEDVMEESMGTNDADNLVESDVQGPEENGDGEDIQLDPEFDDELNALEQELDSLLLEGENELNALEGEL